MKCLECLLGTWFGVVPDVVVEPCCWCLEEQCVHGGVLVDANGCEIENPRWKDVERVVELRY